MRRWKQILLLIVAVMPFAFIAIYDFMREHENLSVEPVDLKLDGSIRQIDIEYTWWGFGPLRHDNYQVICSNGQCMARGQRTVLQSYGKVLTGTVLILSHTVPLDVVQGFSDSLVELRPVSRPLGYGDICEPKCEIYAAESEPHYHITMTTTHGQVIGIRNGSNYTGPDLTDLAPWNVQVEGQWYFQKTGEIPDSYRRMAHAIDPDYSYPRW